MVNSQFAAVIMAAGKSTRMKSALPKAAHPICGKPMARHIISACRKAGVADIIVIVGHEAQKVKDALGGDVAYACQSEQLGTGHAVMQAFPHIPDHCAAVLVLPADTPLITSGAIKSLMQTHLSESNAATLLSAELDDASHYGRVVRKSDGSVLRVCEAKDADEATLAICEINTSIYCFDKHLLAKNLALLKTDNAQGEYYLTDVIELLNKDSQRVGATSAKDSADTLGINNRIELAKATAAMRKRILNKLMLAGVTIIDPETTYVDWDVEIGRDTTLHPCTIIESGSKIGSGCEIGPFVRLSQVIIPDATDSA